MIERFSGSLDIGQGACDMMSNNKDRKPVDIYGMPDKFTGLICANLRKWASESQFGEETVHPPIPAEFHRERRNHSIHTH